MANMLTREYLEFQSDRIERVLASHRVLVRVQGGSVTPRWVRYHVIPQRGAEVATIRNLSEELALALGVLDVHLKRSGDLLALEVPRWDAEPFYLLPMLQGLREFPPLTPCLGVTEAGGSLLIHLPSPDITPLLITGASGSGKTELLRTIVLSLVLTNRQSRLQIALIDPQGRNFMPFAELPHLLAPVATSAPAGLSLLERLINELERRDREKVNTPHILIIVDELMDLLSMGGKLVEIALTRLAQCGREVGLHLVVGAQVPSAVLSMLKANFPARLVGRVGSLEEARIAAGIAASSAVELAGRGDFLAIVGGQATRFQAAWVPQQDWAALIKLSSGSGRAKGFRGLAVDPRANAF